MCSNRSSSIKHASLGFALGVVFLLSAKPANGLKMEGHVLQRVLQFEPYPKCTGSTDAVPQLENHSRLLHNSNIFSFLIILVQLHNTLP